MHETAELSAGAASAELLLILRWKPSLVITIITIIIRHTYKEVIQNYKKKNKNRLNCFRLTRLWFFFKAAHFYLHAMVLSRVCYCIAARPLASLHQQAVQISDQNELEVSTTIDRIGLDINIPWLQQSFADHTGFLELLSVGLKLPVLLLCPLEAAMASVLMNLFWHNC